jgi:hypothetical protein
MDVMPNVKVSELFDKIVNNVTDAEVYALVDDAKEEYVWDWEDEFRDIDEAYAECGRGCAEDHVVQEIMHEHAPSDISSDDLLALREMLFEHWGLSDE